MGQDRVDQFVRFYVTPGVNHPGNGVMKDGKAVPAKVDLLGVLDAWVDSGKTPDTLVQVSQEEQAPFKTIASQSGVAAARARVGIVEAFPRELYLRTVA